MLQKLNERIQGLVAWIIITLVAITFTLFGVDYYMQSHHGSSAQVEVNGQPITKQTVELSYRRARQSRDPSKMTAAGENQLKQQILNELIVNNVSVQSAQSSGFEVNAAQADAAILKIPQFQKEGHFSSDRYTQALNNAFFTPESFQKEVRQGMLLNQQRFALIGTSFALPGDISKFVNLYMQTRDYDYLQVPMLQFLNKTKVSEQDITTWYTQHKQSFIAPEKISIDYMQLSLQEIKKTIKLSEEQIRQYYDENSSTINKPFPEVQAEIKEQLLVERAQEKYARKLEKLSDLSYQTPDSLTPVADALKMKIEESVLFSKDGGNSPLLKNKQVIEAAFSHDVLELGNNSEPVQLDNDTVVVLRVHKHVPAAEKPLNEVRLVIADQLAREHAEADAMRVGKEILKAQNNPAQLNKLISENHYKWKTVKQAVRDSDVAPELVNELAFTLSRSGEKNGRSLANGDYVIVSLKSINNGTLESLDKEHINSITQQIEANYGVMDYELYVAALMSKADIVKHS